MKTKLILNYFKIPLFVLFLIILYLCLYLFGFSFPALLIIFLAIVLGSYSLFKEIITSLLKKQFALDYIAVLAIITSVITQEYLVAGIIALMLTTGRTLEAYGTAQAKKSLSLLINRIPQTVTVIKNGQIDKAEKIADIKINQEILIRKGEIIPLDGILISEQALTDESSLTGEPYHIEKIKGDTVRSGTINTGQPVIVKVTKVEKDSTYKKIIEMVRRAQDEKSPFIRLADKYSTIFTITTFIIAAFAFILSHDLKSILAVLVIATPCPLIIAAPIALLGGVNKAAKKRIIIKKLAGIEALAKIDTFVFDKTGTITIGKPLLTHIEILDKSYSTNEILGIALAIERNSLHPIAKTIIEYAKNKNTPTLPVSNIIEKIGHGISGEINKKSYTLSKIEEDTAGMAIMLLQEKKQIATFHFEDVIKKESKQTIAILKKLGLDLYIFTGDRKNVADHIASQLDNNVHVEAELKPEDKQRLVKELKQKHHVVAMVGDGINDAPALAIADVGLVFSHEEQTAASEAADIVLLGGDFSLTEQTISISKRTIKIAVQSMKWGIGLSIFGMILAAFGLIPPIFGAGIQEAIDVAVILNALRASR